MFSAGVPEDEVGVGDEQELERLGVVALWAGGRATVGRCKPQKTPAITNF